MKLWSASKNNRFLKWWRIFVSIFKRMMFTLHLTNSEQAIWWNINSKLRRLRLTKSSLIFTIREHKKRLYLLINLFSCLQKSQIHHETAREWSKQNLCSNLLTIPEVLIIQTKTKIIFFESKKLSRNEENSDWNKNESKKRKSWIN